MSLESLHNELNSLAREIEENEKKFDLALQHQPTELDYARQLYRFIKDLETRVAEIKTKIDQSV